MSQSSGLLFRKAVQTCKPLPVVGTINAYTALLAQKAGCQAIYLSGSGVASASHGIPDLGMTNLTEVLEDARRILEVSPLPLLVDVDTGWGHAFNIARTVKSMENAGVAAIHIEDQILAKRCGHRPNKSIVSLEEMSDRIKIAVDARKNPDFVIMARTDAFASEGMPGVIDRASRYIELGADMIFPEAIRTLEEYKILAENLSVPVLANITEFGNTPLFTQKELGDVGVSLVLYPLSAFRAMSKAALSVYECIMQQGSQAMVLETMQTRAELYDVLGYHQYEATLNTLMEEES